MHADDSFIKQQLLVEDTNLIIYLPHEDGSCCENSGGCRLLFIFKA